MKVTKIVYVDGMFDGPAASDIENGVMYINEPVYNKLNDSQRRMVYLHEEGHIVLETRDEVEADQYAFKRYTAEGRSLKESVKSLTDILEGTGAEPKARIETRINDALYYDWKINKNSRALGLIQGYNLPNIMHSKSNSTSDISYFLGLPSPASIINNLIDNHNKKVDARIDRKNTTTQAKADAKLLLAQNGVSQNTFGTSFGQGLGALTNGVVNGLVNPASGVSGLFGGSGGNNVNPYTNAPLTPQELAAQQAAQEEAAKKQTQIIIGVVVFIVIAAAAYFISKNKSN